MSENISQDNDLKRVLNRIATLEHHVINLIIPIQFINELQEKVEKPINQFYSVAFRLLAKLQSFDLDQLKESAEQVKKADKNLKEVLSDIKILMKKIDLSDEIKAYAHKNQQEKSKDIATHSKSQDSDKKLLKLLDILTDHERQVIIHRIGLFGEKKKIYKEIAPLVNYSPRGVGYLYKRAIHKLRSPHLKYLVRNCTSTDLKSEIFGVN